VKSDLFRVDSWDSNGSDSHSVTSAQNFKVHIRKSENPKRSVQVSCQISGSQAPKLVLNIQLVRLHEIWAVKEVYARQKNSKTRKKRVLFLSNILADLCSGRVPDGKMLSISL
jgi:hypothetical protein